MNEIKYYRERMWKFFYLYNKTKLYENKEKWILYRTEYYNAVYTYGENKDWAQLLLDFNSQDNYDYDEVINSYKKTIALYQNELEKASRPIIMVETNYTKLGL